MPIAVTGGSERKQLKTAPPDGYVVIKRMSHGQKLQRGDLNNSMKVNTSRKSKDVSGEISIMQERITLWEWHNLIEEHNLQDFDGRVLDFKNPTDIRKVDGRIAEEINVYIGEINNFEDDLDDEESELGKSASTSEQGF